MDVIIKDNKMVVADNQALAVDGGGIKIQFSDGCSKITNKTSYTETNAKIVVEESGTYKVTWFHYAYAADSTSSYATQIYVNNSAKGSAHASPAYSGTPASVSESNIQLNVGDTIAVRARTRSGSSYYTVVMGLIIEKTN